MLRLLSFAVFVAVWWGAALLAGAAKLPPPPAVLAAAVAEARAKAQVQVEQARSAIEQDRQMAQDGLQAESGKLAAEIIRAVLQPATAVGGR